MLVTFVNTDVLFNIYQENILIHISILDKNCKNKYIYILYTFIVYYYYVVYCKYNILNYYDYVPFLKFSFAIIL